MVSDMKPPMGIVASKSHTAGLVFLILALSLWAAAHSAITEWPTTFSTAHARLLTYVQLPLLPALWVAYIWAGVRRRMPLASLIVERGATRRRWLRYAAVGLGALVLWVVVSGALSAALRPTPDQLRGLQAMLPHSAVERWVWLAFAPTAGVFEEIVYRGYLLRQLRALTHSPSAALVLQALTYAGAHLVLPASMLAPIALLGLYLGLLTVWQRSLIPAMLVHAGVAVVAIAGAA